jgi:hypothetical protein
VPTGTPRHHRVRPTAHRRSSHASLRYQRQRRAVRRCRNRHQFLPEGKPHAEVSGAQARQGLETRGGIRRYDANKTGQTFSPKERYATGIRTADGIAIDPQDQGPYATQHGRDELSEDLPNLYKPKQGADLPAEELIRVEQGADYGWPECYFDQTRNKLVLAPQYGGDGGKKVSVCADKKPPIAWFPLAGVLCRNRYRLPQA